MFPKEIGITFREDVLWLYLSPGSLPHSVPQVNRGGKSHSFGATNGLLYGHISRIGDGAAAHGDKRFHLQLQS